MGDKRVGEIIVVAKTSIIQTVKYYLFKYDNILFSITVGGEVK